MADLELTKQQAAALEKVHRWLDRGASGGVFRLGGYAGTGKTTIASLLAQSRPVEFGAYTGKAVQVLRSKGLPADTLHRLMYLPVGGDGSPEVRALIDRIRNTYDDGKRALLAHQLRKATSNLAFGLNDGSRLTALREAGGVLVVDEASMVDASMAADLALYKVPIVALGDPMQLPPIGAGKGTLFAPDKINVMLTDIQRQTGWLADAMNYVRKNKRTPRELYRSKLDRLDADQIITYTNRKRWETIITTRNRLGRSPNRVVPGDRIIVTMNNTDLDVFNGQQFEVLNAVEKDLLTWRVDGRDAVTGVERELTVWHEGFLGFAGETALAATPYREQKYAVCATFAQAITCHKAQGSEWGKIIVVEESGIRDKAKWLYTAVTRARDVCRVVKPA